MSKVLRHRERATHTEFALHFHYKIDPHAGFSFPCDESGAVDCSAMAPEGIANLTACLEGTNGTLPDGVVKYEWSYWEPGAVLCDCGCVSFLDDSFANSCENCGAEYSGTGQRLAPRSQWGGEWASQPEEDINLYTPDYSDGDKNQ